MKKIYLLALVGFSIASMNAQTIFSSNLEDWTGTDPDDFMGNKNSLEADSIIKITTGAVYGNNTVQLVNTQSSHKRLSTQAVSVELDTLYEIEFWVRGVGDIRTGLYDGEMNSGDFGYTYGAYESVNSPSAWVNFTQTIYADTTTSAAEFILSVRNTVAGGHLEIDSMVVRKGIYVAPSFTSIYDIQYTTDVSGDSPLVGQIVATGGIVTAVHANGSFNMSSGTGPWTGILVYTTQNTVAEGDSVTFTAEVQEYQGLTEMAYPTDFVKVSSGNFFMSNSVTTTQANTEDYEGCLVTTTNANCTTDGSWWTINDVEFYLSFKILPRYANDVSVSTGINENNTLETSIYPNPANDIVTIDAPLNSVVTIYSVEGKVVMNRITNNTIEMINVSSLENGSYIVSIENNNAVSTQILIKK
jgi:hypothetical protein